MRLWKVLGLAGLAGVAAGGVVVVRAERRRRAYAPEEIRARLHQRLAEVDAATPVAPATAVTSGRPAVYGVGRFGPLARLLAAPRTQLRRHR